MDRKKRFSFENKMLVSCQHAQLYSQCLRKSSQWSRYFFGMNSSHWRRFECLHMAVKRKWCVSLC